MSAKDWLVTNEGECEPRPSLTPWSLVREHYYLHQFLSDIMAILAEVPLEAEEWNRLPHIRQHVRQLVMNSYWVRTQVAPPNPHTGVGIQTLYDEIGYPLTVQTERLVPGTASPIHNHGTWGVVAIIEGKEEHTFWRRPSESAMDPSVPHGLTAPLHCVGRKVLYPGEIISFMPNAIHQVTALGPHPTLSFCLYGDTQPHSRFRYDPQANTATRF